MTTTGYYYTGYTATGAQVAVIGPYGDPIQDMQATKRGRRWLQETQRAVTLYVVYADSLDDAKTRFTTQHRAEHRNRGENQSRR